MELATSAGFQAAAQFHIDQMTRLCSFSLGPLQNGSHFETFEVQLVCLQQATSELGCPGMTATFGKLCPVPCLKEWLCTHHAITISTQRTIF